jgi:hypothetical protein
MQIGPNAQAIFDALPERPAAVIARQANHVQHTFAALFNGAVSPGHFDPSVLDGRPFFGKAEAEWHWPKDWDALVALGLVTYRTEIKPAPGARSGQTTLIHWQITPKGWEVRLDDLAWFAEMSAAREADEATRQ